MPVPQHAHAARRPATSLLLLVLIGLVATAAACSRRPSPPPGPAPLTLRTDQVELLLQTLKEAPSHGFRPGAFPIQDIAVPLHGADAGARNQAEQTLVRRIIAYARAQRGLAIPPRRRPLDWGLRPAAYDADADFRQALAGGRLRSWLAGLPPPSSRYAALRSAYDAYLKIMASGGWSALPTGSSLAEGARGPQVQALRDRLAVEDAAIDVTAGDAPFDQALTAAVQRAQNRYGLKPTGVVDADLVAALNVPADARAAQIRANLERLRWTSRSQAPTRIEVNSAAGTFDLYVDGAPALHMLAATGRPGDETPILSSAVRTIVFNPAWNVPDQIAVKELFPKQQRNPGYFAREGFVRGQHTRLKQKPGPKNALGQVKFVFPNPYQVYLHDTPAKSAFSRSNRSVSHGCVRLERALDLAERLLSQSSDWSPDRVEQILASDKTTSVRLTRPVPVALDYWTAFPEDNRVSFRPDVYGWDILVLRLLDADRSGQG